MKLRSTTVLAVLRDGQGAIGSDGQVTLGNTAVKHGAVKVRQLFGGQVLAGFAGGAADAFSLFEEKGIFDTETGRSFLTNILEKGGSADPLELFISFRGREPSVDALLKHSGLSGTDKAA